MKVNKYMKTFLKKIFAFLFKKEEIATDMVTAYIAPPVGQPGYVPFRSETLQKYLASKGVNLNDPLDASVKLRKFFRSTQDTADIKGNIDSKKDVIITAASDIVVLNVRDLILNQCSLIIKSELKNTIVIINVSGKFKLNRNAKLDLRGIPPENVLVNYTGVFQPILSLASYFAGTIVTMHRLLVLNKCRLDGETIGSEPNVSNGIVVNKSTVNSQTSTDASKKVSDERAGDSIFEKKKW